MSEFSIKNFEFGRGFSLHGRKLYMYSIEDATNVVKSILACKELVYLDFTGNTFGVEALAAVAEALSKHPEIKYAILSNVFTGYQQQEFSQATKYLLNGLTIANIRLTELDLSNNSLGSGGAPSLGKILKSHVCENLNILNVNNNDLKIEDCRILSKAIQSCIMRSNEQGKQFPLKVFCVGQNHFGNDGAIVLVKALNLLTTIEEIDFAMNDIDASGMIKLAEVFLKNKDLQVIDLTDNMIGVFGCGYLANAVAELPKLRVLCLGDCEIQNRGAELLARSIVSTNIEVLNCEYNEIMDSGVLAIVNAVAHLPNLRKLYLDGNILRFATRLEIKTLMCDHNHFEALEIYEDTTSSTSDDEIDARMFYE